jgi:hypothetical protein
MLCVLNTKSKYERNTKFTKYPYLKWQWIFYFLRRYFLSSIPAKPFTGLYIQVARRVSYQKQEPLSFRERLWSLPVFGGVRVANLF